MKKKYNLAFMPIEKSHAVISLAGKFSHLADEYILGDKSFPHVTLCHFYAEEEEIEMLWKRITDAWINKYVDLTFNEFSCITFDGNIFWVSLLPDNCEALHDMHVLAAKILQQPVKKTFNPHMTLINSKNESYKKEAALIAGSYNSIRDKFVLSLGESDEVGQVVGIVYRL